MRTVELPCSVAGDFRIVVLLDYLEQEAGLDGIAKKRGGHDTEAPTLLMSMSEALQGKHYRVYLKFPSTLEFSYMPSTFSSAINLRMG
jgi:hypothetical protein